MTGDASAILEYMPNQLERLQMQAAAIDEQILAVISTRCGKRMRDRMMNGHADEGEDRRRPQGANDRHRPV